MNIIVREFEEKDLTQTMDIWNTVVEDGEAFPQEEIFSTDEALDYFTGQSFTGVAVDLDTNKILGVYVLHPNNIGRAGHLCNPSFAVAKDSRGLHIGEKLVSHCLAKGAELGFKVLQLNVVVANNTRALALYKKMGFVQMGVVPGGFRMKDGHYEDIIPHYHLL